MGKINECLVLCELFTMKWRGSREVLQLLGVSLRVQVIWRNEPELFPDCKSA